MKILMACEFSGIGRDIFIERGHECWSCDLLPGEGKYTNRHIQDDVLNVLGYNPNRTSGPGLTYTGYGYVLPNGLRIWENYWDMIIAHAECTYLCNSGVRWLYKNGKGNAPDSERWSKMHQARDFFLKLWNAKAYRICIENPIPHRHAELPPYSQIIQPHDFGHGETKATCLWLKNLPDLKPTDKVDGREARIHRMAPGPNRSKERSRSYPGILRAMAEQWT